MKDLRHVFMVACLMVMLPAMAGSGYLSTVGPIPLRLSATAGARPDVAAVLPPLDPPRSLPPISEPTKALIDPTASQKSLKISPSEKAPAELIWFGPPLPVEMIGPPLGHLAPFRHGIATGISAAHGVPALMCKGVFYGID